MKASGQDLLVIGTADHRRPLTKIGSHGSCVMPHAISLQKVRIL